MMNDVRRDVALARFSPGCCPPFREVFFAWPFAAEIEKSNISEISLHRYLMFSESRDKKREGRSAWGLLFFAS